ncbi:MAG TPA: hypothetical protein VG755_22525 [Nannocystaceae bacterium]|nr:hypothetical protein [Nannocystaceae bacterium]
MNPLRHDITLPSLPHSSSGSPVSPRERRVRLDTSAYSAGLGGTLRATASRHRVFGSMRGIVIAMSEDFDAPLDDFAEYVK